MKTKVTSELYAAAKIMIKGGASIDEVAKFLKIGAATVSRIKSAETYEEYKQIVAACWAKSKEKEKLAKEAQKELDREIKRQEEAAEQGQEKPVKRTGEAFMVSSYQVNRLIEIMKEQNEILKIMSNKIAFIVDELTK